MVRFQIESATLHPDFERRPLLVNDLALLRLSEEAREEDRTKEMGPAGNRRKVATVRPVCLGKEGDEIMAPDAAGWGLVDRENASRVLQVLRLDRVVPAEECEDIYRARHVQGKTYLPGASNTFSNVATPQ